MMNKPVEEIIVDTIIRHVRPRRIILFGSRARDDAQQWSDYDVAIDCDQLHPAILAQIRADMEMIRTLRRIDVVWMHHITSRLRERILKEGRILYEQQS